MAEFEPRFNSEAEEGVLGIALIDRNAIPRIVADLTTADFYSPRCAVIFGAIAELYSTGHSVDVVTVGDVLSRAGRLEEIGGGSVFIEMMNGVGSTGSLNTYTAIVRREAAARSIQRSVGLARTAIDENDDPVAVAETLVSQLEALDRGGRLPERYWRDARDYLAADHSETVTPLAEGVSNPLSRIMVIGTEKAGKALAVDTPIPTPHGWVTMGELEVGDEVFGPDGKPRHVIAATEVMYGRECYSVQFKDGREIVADAGHLWRTTSYEERQPGWRRFPDAVRTTQELAETVSARNGHTWNHQIPTAEPLNFEPLGDLPISPYTFGAWLGDGTSRSAEITCADPEILREIESEGYEVKKLTGALLWSIAIPRDQRVERPDRAASRLVNTLGGRLNRLGVKTNKHIPELYFRASVADRVSLLQGLMDTDGTASDVRGLSRCEFSVCNERLARDFYRLVTELGVKASLRSSDAKIYGRVVGKAIPGGF